MVLRPFGKAAGATLGWYIASTVWDVSRGTVPHAKSAWVGAVADFGVAALLT